MRAAETGLVLIAALKRYAASVGPSGMRPQSSGLTKSGKEPANQSTYPVIRAPIPTTTIYKKDQALRTISFAPRSTISP